MGGTLNPLIAAYNANQNAQAPALGTSIGVALPSSAPSVGPSLGTPLVTQAPPTQTQADQTERNRLINTGSGLDQISNPLLRGIARTADIVGSVFAPNLAQFIPGTTLHHQLLVNQATNNVEKDQAADDQSAQIQQRQALAQQEEAKASQLTDPQKAVDPSKTVQTDDGVYQLNPVTGKYDIRVGDTVQKPAKPVPIEQQAYDFAIKSGKNPLDAYAAVYGAKNTKTDNLPEQYLEAQQSGDTVKADLIRKTIQDTQTAPKITVLNAAAANRADAAATKADTTKTAKLSSDEQKRADLAQNMNENINALEDIANRRPDLFGPVAGRLTDAKTALGTSDPDIAQLQVIKHQLGMVAQGAHGMRSAQGVESAANSLTNGYHNSPEATKAALEAARSSVKTFLSDANNPGQSRGEGNPPAMVRALDPNGVLHEAPAGTPLPAGWKAQ